MPRVVHFEIHADNPERAAKFYLELFGWTFQKWEGPQPYWMIVTGPDSEPGINGGMLPRMSPIDGQQGVVAYVCTVSVANLDVALIKAKEQGGSVAMPKMPIPGVGWLAYCKNTEGNLFGMMQPDPAAQ